MVDRDAARRELVGILEARTGQRATVALILGRADGAAVWLGVASVPSRAWRVLRWPDGRWESRPLDTRH